VAAVADHTNQCVAMMEVITAVSANFERKLAVIVDLTWRWLTREHANVSNSDLSLNHPRYLLELFSQSTERAPVPGLLYCSNFKNVFMGTIQHGRSVAGCY